MALAGIAARYAVKAAEGLGGAAGIMTLLMRSKRPPMPGMSVGVTVQSNVRAEGVNIDKLLRQHDRITAQALNKAVRMARTETVRELARVKDVPQKPIRRRVRAYMAYPNVKPIRSAIWIGLKKPIQAKEIGGSLRTGGTVRIGRRTYRGAFLATMPSGHRGIFHRKPNATHRRRRLDGQRTQLPIEEGVVRLDPEAGPLSRRIAEKHLKETYPPEVKRLMRLHAERQRRRR